MKKILLTIIGIAASAAMMHAQGLVQFYSPVAGIITNTATIYQTGYPPVLGGTSGSTFSQSTSPGAYTFILLAATSTTAADSGNPLGPDWSPVNLFGGGLAVATNGAIAGSLQGPGGTSGFSSSLAAGTTYFEMVVGWSSNLGNWTAVQNALQSPVSWVDFGYVGYSAIGTITPTTSPSPAAAVFTGSGIPTNSTILYVNEVPEPAALALAGLGGLSILFLRRRRA